MINTTNQRQGNSSDNNDAIKLRMPSGSQEELFANARMNNLKLIGNSSGWILKDY